MSKVRGTGFFFQPDTENLFSHPKALKNSYFCLTGRRTVKGIEMLLKTVNDEGNLAYLLIDTKTNFALVIDPVKERTDDLLNLIRKNHYEVPYVIDTHSHADHFSGAGLIAGALGSQVVMGKATPKQREFDTRLGEKFGIRDILDYNAGIQVDILAGHGETLPFGSGTLTFFETPGHTLNSISVLAGRYLFTGDSLMIGQTGRLDLPGGDAATMFRTLNEVIRPLADDTLLLCPGHDYDHNASRLLKDEIEENAFYRPQTEIDFIEFAGGFFPPLKLEDMGGISRIQCGAAGGQEKPEQGLFTILPPELQEKTVRDDGTWMVIDVREPYELRNGKIPQAVNIPLSELESRLSEIPKNKRIAVVCQSGGRSTQVCNFLHQNGWPSVYNMTGGMMLWQLNFLPVSR